MDNTTLDVINISSSYGVVIATMFIVEVLKRSTKNVAWVNRVPIFVYAMSIAALLSVFANKVMKVDGKPMLPGSNVWVVVWKSVTLAGSASGFYNWLRNQETPKTASKGIAMRSSVLGLMVALLMVGGCASVSPQHITFRESVAPLGRAALNENVELVDRIANNRPLPKFTPTDVQLRKDARDSFNALIEEDKK